MKYVIKMDYITGNSFGSENAVGYVELSWENLEIAKENLQRIKEHYLFYKSLKSYYLKNDLEKIRKEAETKPWFCKKSDNPYLSVRDVGESHVMLKLDSGLEINYYTGMWCGYFERLTCAEIVPEPVDDSEMRVTF